MTVNDVTGMIDKINTTITSLSLMVIENSDNTKLTSTAESASNLLGDYKGLLGKLRVISPDERLVDEET